jgi:DNA polymerase
VLKCRPPGNRDPQPAEIQASESHLFRQIDLIRPTLVCNLGNIATKLLSKLLEGIGLSRDEVYIANVLKCRPPGNRDPQPDELSACDEYTQRQIAVLRPKVIVTLGRYSMARFFGPGGAMGKMHGASRSWNGIACIAMYHPAYILRAQTPQMMRTYQEDFEKIVALLEHVKGQAKAAPEPATLAVAEPVPEPARVEQPRLF